MDSKSNKFGLRGLPLKSLNGFSCVVGWQELRYWSKKLSIHLSSSWSVDQYYTFIVLLSVFTKFFHCPLEHGCLIKVNKCLKPILFIHLANTSVKCVPSFLIKTGGTPALMDNFCTACIVNFSFGEVVKSTSGQFKYELMVIKAWFLCRNGVQ